MRAANAKLAGNFLMDFTAAVKRVASKTHQTHRPSVSTREENLETAPALEIKCSQSCTSHRRDMGTNNVSNVL